MNRLTSNKFSDHHDVTVGAESSVYDIKIEEKVIRLQLWDTAGQEQFKSITKIFYRNAHAVVICYSVGDRSSFDHLNDWLNEVNTNCTKGVLLFLAGTKADL